MSEIASSYETLYGGLEYHVKGVYLPWQVMGLLTDVIVTGYDSEIVSVSVYGTDVVYGTEVVYGTDIVYGMDKVSDETIVLYFVV